jgi:ribonuclease P protein component
MLAPNNRLRKPRDITRVYKRGVYGGADGRLSIKAAPSGRAESRVVVVVSKKVDKRAVVRNRIRRRLIEILRAQWATLPGGYDIVISVHSDISAAPATDLRAALATALGRARVTST